MDQFASVFGKAGSLIRLNCKTLQYKYFPFNPKGYKLVLLDSCVKHELASSAYNKRRKSCENAAAAIRKNHPDVEFLSDAKRVWLPDMKGGADTTLYELHRCNWERDFLTTAVPNPQQGANAPLVGLTVGDVVTRSEDGTYSVQKQTVLVDEDGSKYGVSYKVSEDGERLVGVDYDPVSEKTPVTAINSYAELAALATEQDQALLLRPFGMSMLIKNSWNLTCVKASPINKLCKVVGTLISVLMNF